MKTTEKVSCNIASEASYVYILSGQKLIENAKKWFILASFGKPKAFGQTVLPDKSALIGQKMVKMLKLKNSDATFKSNFQTMCLHIVLGHALHFPNFLLLLLLIYLLGDTCQDRSQVSDLKSL